MVLKILRGFSLVIFCYLFFHVNSCTFASSISLQSDKNQINGIDDEYFVNANLSINAADGTNYYLRGVFYKPRTTKYCGYTWNGNNWFSGPYTSGDGWKNFLQVTINDNSWSGELRAKLDNNDNDCNTSGVYNFKIIRYTSSGSPSSSDSVNELTVEVLIPSPAPSPTEMPIPTKEPTPTRTPAPTHTPFPTRTPTPTKVPTPTKTPTPSKIPTFTKVPTPTKIPTATSINSNSSKISNNVLAANIVVLSASGSSTKNIDNLQMGTETATLIPTAVLAESTSSPDVQIKDANKERSGNEVKIFGISRGNILGILLGLGGIIMLVCGILLVLKYKNKIFEHEEEI